MIEVISVSHDHPYPPRISEFTKPFWDALAEGRFITTRSRASGALTFPPKPISPQDWSGDMEWVDLSGNGVLYSYTTIHAAPAAFVADLPYIVCIVDLDEGLRLATRYLGNSPQIGEQVKMVSIAHPNSFSFGALAL